MSESEALLLGSLCCVPSCINSYGNRDCAQFYHFPINPQLCEIWKTRINNPNIMHLPSDKLKETRICDLHFEGINKSRWGLCKNSLPTLGLPGYLEPTNDENCFGTSTLQLTVHQLPTICRICYSQDNLYDISTSKYQNISIECIYNDLTNDKYFSKENYPSNICLSCIKLLIQSKLFLEQVCNAAKLFDQLMTQEPHYINVITSDCERTIDNSLKLCQLQIKSQSIDNGVQNPNGEHFSAVYLPINSEDDATINSVNVKLENQFNKKDCLENDQNVEPIDNQNDTSAKDSSSNLINPGISSNPITMSYSTFIRTTRRSSHVNIEPHKYLDTNGGPVIINYLTEEGSNQLNPSSVQLPTSSGRFSGVLNVPAINIRCNMDLDTSENEGKSQKVQKHFLDSSLNDISQMVEVKMDVEKTPEKSKSGKIYRCEHCSEEFSDKFVYKRHKKEHNTKKFMCTVCQATFNTGTECSKHKMSHTRACEVCGKNIQRKCYMTHLKTHDESKKERHEQAKAKGQKVCTKCGRVFKRRWAFHSPCHTSAGPGKFQCDQCPFRTHYHKTLKQHMLVHAPAADQFVCATCGDCFATEDVLNKHTKMQHLRSAKLLPCKWCPSTFDTRYDRTKHLTTEHGKKPLKEYRHPPTKFKCNYCSMTFVTADNLRLHLWSHPNATDAELELNNPSTSKNTTKGK